MPEGFNQNPGFRIGSLARHRNRIDVVQHHAAQTFLAPQRFHHLVDEQASLVNPKVLGFRCDECAHGLNASAGRSALDIAKTAKEELVETHLFLRPIDDHPKAGQVHNMEESLPHAETRKHGPLKGVAYLHVLQFGIIDKIAKLMQEVDVN